MVLDTLGSALKDTLKKIAGAVFVNERMVDELVRDIQRALLQADVNVKLVFELTNSIKKRALGEKTPGGMTQREHVIKIVYDELVKFFGEEKHGIEIKKKKPFKIMMVGLYGAGKSTSIGKLAHYYSKRGYKVATVGLDVHRPAAPEQLKQLAEKVRVDCYIDPKEKDPLKIYKTFEKNFGNYDILIIDTAGRDALSKDLIQEIEDVNSLVKPDENLLVISADIGQAAMAQAEQFHKSCGITGVVVTKLDGTAKGGGSLSACAVTKAPIKFIGVGEKIDDLEQFNPSGFVGRLLGMGDLEALLEKAKESIDEGKADDLRKKLVEGDFNLLDLYEQMSAMRKMGPLSKIMEMMPGMGHLKIPKEMLGAQEEKLKHWKIIMDSCTKKELEDPDLIDAGRITRLSKGSGIAAGEIREMLKQYRQSKKLMKMMKGKDPSKMMQNLGKLKMK